MSTGFSTERAAPHEHACRTLIGALLANVIELPVEGHRPDLFIHPNTYIDVKTGGPNIAVELESLAEYRRVEHRGGRVYIVHARSTDDISTWTVDTPDTLTSRIQGGPRPRSGTGSLDDWYLVRAGGTRLVEFPRLPLLLDVLEQAA